MVHTLVVAQSVCRAGSVHWEMPKACSTMSTHANPQSLYIRSYRRNMMA